MSIDLNTFMNKDEKEQQDIPFSLEELGSYPELIEQFNKMLLSCEEFKVKDKEIADIIDKSRKLSADEFKSTIKEGDVVVAYKKQGYVEKGKMIGRAITSINKWLQGSSFTSCKVVGRDAKEIVGYGVLAGKPDIRSAAIRTFLIQHEGVVICRHNDMKPGKAKLVLDKLYWHRKMNTDYDFATLLESVLWHMLRQWNLDKSNKEFNEQEQSKLICSSLILKIFQECGLEVKHDNGVGDKFIWPREFLTSPNFTVVGTYFSDEANVE